MFAQLIQDPPATAINYIQNPAAPAAIDEFGQLEKLASTFHHVDGLFYFTYAVCIFFFVVITGVLLFSCIKYRRKTFDQPPASNTTHNTPLEVVWTVIPLIIVMVMFAWGFKGSLDMTTVPFEASRNMYKASAKQWDWTFSYPNDPAVSYGELWLQVNKPAGFLLESKDVLHAFYMPAMRVKRDVIPGRYQTLWFEPTEIGDYHLFCAEYCGEGHSTMYTKVHVVSEADYQKRPWDVWDDSTPAAAAKSGRSLYDRICFTCHSLNGTPMTGPSWKGLFVKGPDGKITGGQREVFVGGQKQTITVDDAYITESILKPDAKKAAGFQNNAMPTQALDERRIKGIIELMKSLAETN
ncbi:MAG TPA: cytochrome c oxidase subunit II [Planctomycetota bacterium]|nr:cytochrome c oxidase subunit II [Planctomycetota bacterium]